jgi:hypothetical protein
MAESIDLTLLSRLRDVLADEPVTEAELRVLSEQADGLVRALRGQVEATERRLDALTADQAASLSDLAGELRRVEILLPRLAEARTLLARLDVRARELRSEWLLRQAAPVRARGDDAPPGS